MPFLARRLGTASILLLAVVATGCSSTAQTWWGDVDDAGTDAGDHASSGSSGGSGSSSGGHLGAGSGGGSGSSSGTSSGPTSSGSSGGTTGSGSGGTAGSSSGGGSSSGSTSSSGGALDVPPAATRGASVPYFEYEAEDPTVATVSGGTTLTWASPTTNTENDGTPIATFEALEASGRAAVQLRGAGQSISFTLQHRASSIVVRYSIPDSSDGNPQGAVGRDNDATLGLYVDGTRQDLHLTSRYSWTYGTLASLDAPGIANQSPGGDAHHLYDEARALFAHEMPVGTVVKLQQDAQDTAAFYVIDLVDFEDLAPPATQPAGSISITDPAYGATPDDGTDDSAAVIKAIADATSQNKVLWIPPGDFTMAPAPANLQNVAYNAVPKLILTGSITIQGAGMWYSALDGFGAQFELMGRATSTSPALAVTYEFHDFSVLGDVTWRKDADGGWMGFDGPWGQNSKIENVWIEHENAGIWLGAGWQFPTPLSSPMTQNLTVTGVRIRDTYADGINMNDGTSGTTIEQTNVRNTGDDALVTWSYSADGTYPCQNNVVQYDSVQTVWHANCYALYGGQNNTFENDVCADTANMAGVFLATDFTVIPFAGANVVAHTTLTRAGGWHGTSYDYAGEGALMFFATPQQVADFTIQDLLIDSPILSGIQFSGGSESNVTLSGITVQSYGTQGIEIEGSVNGAVEMDNVAVGGSVNVPYKNDGASMTIDKGSGDTGW
jgi:Pectate lyase superfamily protein